MEIIAVIIAIAILAVAALALRNSRAKMTLRALPAPRPETYLSVRSRPHTEEELCEAFWHEAEIVEECNALDAGEELLKLKAEMRGRQTT
jgi:hypothetical protein